MESSSALSTALASFVSTLTGYGSEIATLVVTVASGFALIAGIFLGLRYLVRASKAVK